MPPWPFLGPRRLDGRLQDLSVRRLLAAADKPGRLALPPKQKGPRMTGAPPLRVDDDQKSMPPPPGIGGVAGFSLGSSATIASVVIKRPATDAAS
jgi:hypothetical protein